MVLTPVNAMPAEFNSSYCQILSNLLGIPEHASAMQIHESIVQGYPATLLSALCERGDVTPDEREVIIPLRTFKVRLARQQRLTVAESDRLFSTVHIMAMARAIFGNREKAARWIRKPKKRFNDQSPMSLVRSSQGVRMIEELLMHVAEGDVL